MNHSPEAVLPRFVPGRLRVLVVDACPEVGEPLGDALRSHPALTILGETRILPDLVEITDLRADVVVMHLDVDIDGADCAIDACREIRLAHPGTRVLILASEVREETVISAIAAGASGYLPRDTDASELQQAVVTIASGGSVLDPMMVTAVFERLRDDTLSHPADDAFAELSPQEERILEMIAEGMTNGEIAIALSLSQKTIKNYASQIYAKLNVERRSQAARLATERRMLRQR